MPSGISIQRVSVPIGVIGIIYESRPNVTLDVFSICFKSGNAVVLKGGKEAANSNKKLVSILQNVLNDFGIDKNIVMLLDNARSQTKQILEAHGYIDLIIPRGSANLINFVRENSKVPVIETGAGIVHTYFDEFGDVEKGKDIIYNAKTRRPSVCNSLDTLIIHEKRLNDLPKLIIEMENKNVEIFADPKSFQAIKGFYSSKLLKRASKKHFGNEFLDYKMSIKTVRNIEEAIEHITEFSSKHSEAIITQDKKNAEKFLNTVDAAAVYLNTSTAFTDGAQFGLGAEIGISTQKLHARGPMGLEEMTSYKWIIESDGAVRE